MTVLRSLFLIIGVILLFWPFVKNDKKPANQDQSPPPSPQTSLDKKVVEPEKKPENKNYIPEDIKFPKKFFFGTAYSDFQTAGISKTSDWYDYVKNMKSPQVGPGIGNDLFHRYREDFDNAQKIGIQVHRISLEWSRLEPEEGKWDLKAAKRYNDIFVYMQKRGIQPMICMNHFPLPKWFADKGGWENPKAPYYYARYAQFLAETFGVPLKIHWWLTFNEPQVTLVINYTKGGWPPFKEIKDIKDIEGTQRMMLAMSRLMDAHRLAYRAIHQTMDGKIPDKPMVGFASAVGAFYPNDPNSPLDRAVQNLFNAAYSLMYDYAMGSTDRDFIGINYYGRAKLKLHISVGRMILSWLNEDKPFAIEWVSDKNHPEKMYPQGLYDTIMKFKDLGLPIIITENGINDGDDKYREEFLVAHLSAVHAAMESGVPILGYQYWALTDTWEPGDASFSQMGLIKIDRVNNLARSIRPSAWTYAEIIRTHKITKKLLEKYKELVIK